MEKVYIALTISIVISLLVGITIGSFFPSLFELGKTGVEEKIKRLYELTNPGIRVEVISTKEESGIYRIILRLTDATGSTYREVFVTKDGKLLTTGVIYVESSIERIENIINLVDCLYDKGIRIYGVLNQTQNPQGSVATLSQINLLGGFLYATKLYVSCDGELIANCLNAGVQKVPSVVYKGKVYPGVKTIDWLKDISGC